MQPHHCAALITCMAHESSDRTLGFTGAQVTWQILTLLSSTLLMRFSRRRSSTTSSSSCKMRRREEWTARPGGTRTHSHQHVVGAVFERFIDLSEGDSTLCGLCISSIWLAPTGILKASQLWMSGRPLLLRSRTAACNSDIYLDPLSSPFRIGEPHLGSSGLRLRKRVGPRDTYVRRYKAGSRAKRHDERRLACVRQSLYGDSDASNAQVPNVNGLQIPRRRRRDSASTVSVEFQIPRGRVP